MGKGHIDTPWKWVKEQFAKLNSDVTKLNGDLATKVLYKADKFRITKSGNVIDIQFTGQTCDANGFIDIGEVLKDYAPANLVNGYGARSTDCYYSAAATHGTLGLTTDGKLQILNVSGAPLTSVQTYCAGHLTYIF